MQTLGDLSGSIVRGYELRARIGAGGMGAVYRAWQPVVEREVAVKVILPQYANQPDFIRSFETEAQLVARLEHPHIVPLYDYWREPNSAYLVMRWIRGGSLSKSIIDKGAWNTQSTARLIDQIAAALSVAHRAGVIHRDIKPDNILIDDDANAYLTDFGISKVIGHDETGHGEIKGTLSYIAPEQLTGQGLGVQADIYALGLIIYELLTGKHVFAGSTASELISKHLSETIPNVQILRPELPGRLNEVLQRATAKDPRERFADARELAVAFRQALAEDKSSTVEIAWAISDQVNPYKGLRAFDEADAADFFGRDALVSQLTDRLSEDHPLARFLAVVGPSGSGKSSVVHAGLIPALRRSTLLNARSWFIASFVPGEHPMLALEDALLRVASKPPSHLGDQLRADPHAILWAADWLLGDTAGDLLLVIDQFEEIFTLVQDETERTHFLDMLYIAATDDRSRLRIVITLRADFYDRPLLYEGFGGLIQARTQVVLPLTTAELERAISGPATRVGATVDNELVAAIVTDVRNEPGALPLLQYALTEAFERRDGRRLTLSAYQQSGGVLGALARRADEVYAELSPVQQRIARQIFLRLVTLGEGTEDTRRRVKLTELTSAVGDASEVQAILDKFGRYRLLSFDVESETREPTVEVAHEAIIREWQQLRAWLDESRNDVRLQRVLATATVEWERARRDSSYLLSGARLAQFEEWGRSTDLALTPAERAYLDSSMAERTRLEAIEAERQAREVKLEKRSRGILQALALVLFVGVVGLLISTGVAINRGNEAEAALSTATVAQGQAQIEATNAYDARQTSVFEANNAATQEQIAINSAATSDASAGTAIAAQLAAERSAAESRSLALAASAQQALNGGRSDLALVLALAANGISEPPRGALDALISSAFAPGTRYVFTDQREWVTSAVFSPDGEMLAYGGTDGNVIARNVETREILFSLDPSVLYNGVSPGIYSLAFSPDNQFIAIGGSVGSLSLWDIATQEVVKHFDREHEGIIHGLAFSPDGKMLVSAGDQLFILWDADSGEVIRRFAGHTGTVNGVAFSSDGRYVASGADDGLVILWDVASGAEVRRLIGHQDKVTDVVFSPDGQWIISGSSDLDTAVIVWDAEMGTEIRRFGGLTAVESIAIHPGGKIIATGSNDGPITLWNMDSGNIAQQFEDETGIVAALNFSPDGRYLVSGSSNTHVRLWYVSSPTEMRRLNGYSGLMVISRDGQTVFSGGSDGSVLQWNFETGNDLSRFEGHTDTVLGLALSSDEQTLLTGSFDGTVRLWDIGTSREIHRLEVGKEFYTLRVGFSPDGRTALALAINNQYDQPSQLLLLNAQTLEVIRQIEFPANPAVGLTSPSDAIFSPDGRYVLVGLGKISLIESTGLIRFLDAQSGEVVRELEGPGGSVFKIVYSADGRYIASSASDNTGLLWDAETGKTLRQFVGHSDRIVNLSFSPDGRYLATAGWDQRAILWDTGTGSKVAEYLGHTDPLNAVNFTPDGRHLISSASDKTRRVWLTPLQPQEMIDWIYRYRYVPELTCDQRVQYNLVPLCDEAGAFPTRTPFPTLSPTPSFTPSPTVNLTQVTATPTLKPLPATNTATPSPTLSPAPTLTPTLTLTATPLPVALSPSEIRAQVAGQDFTVFLPAERPNIIVTSVLASQLENFTDMQLFLGSAPAVGDVVFISVIANQQELSVIETHSPFKDAREWAASVMGDADSTFVEYIAVAGVQVAIARFQNSGLYTFVSQETLISILVDDLTAQDGATKQMIAALLEGERLTDPDNGQPPPVMNRTHPKVFRRWQAAYCSVIGR